MRQIQQLAIVIGAAISLLSGCSPEAEVPSGSNIETTSTSVTDVREVDEPDPVYALQPLNEPPSVVKPPPLTVVGPEDAVQISFDDLDLTKLIPDITSEDEAAKQLPEWLQKLHSRRVRIRGFMLPTFAETDLSSFILARDITFNFGPVTRASSIIDVTLREGVTSDYIVDRPFDVAGVLRIGETVEPGAFYRLDDAVILPGPPSKKSR